MAFLSFEQLGITQYEIVIGRLRFCFLWRVFLSVVFSTTCTVYSLLKHNHLLSTETGPVMVFLKRFFFLTEIKTTERPLLTEQ